MRKNSKCTCARILALALAGTMVLSGTAAGTKTAQAKAKVKVSKVWVSNVKNKKLKLAAGKSFTLKAQVKVSPNKKQYRKVKYSSSNKKIASISSTGKIMAKKSGKTMITVASKTDKSKKVKIIVTVTGGDIAVKSVKLNKTSLELLVDDEYTLKATVNPKNATDKGVQWGSSNEKVAEVDDDGVVKGIAPGTATITAVSDDDDSKKASCRVTVKEDTSTAASNGTSNNGQASQAPAVPTQSAPEKTEAPAEESKAPAEESKEPVEESKAPENTKAPALTQAELKMSEDALTEWAASGKQGTVVHNADGSVSYNSEPSAIDEETGEPAAGSCYDNGVAWYLSKDKNAFDLTGYESVEVTLNKKDTAIVFRAWTEDKGAGFWDKNETWNITGHEEKDGKVVLVFPLTYLEDSLSKVLAVGISLKSAVNDDDETFSPKDVIIYSIRFLPKAGEAGKPTIAPSKAPLPEDLPFEDIDEDYTLMDVDLDTVNNPSGGEINYDTATDTLSVVDTPVLTFELPETAPEGSIVKVNIIGTLKGEKGFRSYLIPGTDNAVSNIVNSEEDGIELGDFNWTYELVAESDATHIQLKGITWQDAIDDLEIRKITVAYKMSE